MTQLTTDQVRHIATLARLRLSDDEVNRFTTELTSILKTIDQLSEIDTTGIVATEQVTGQTNVLRTDAVYTESLATPDALLATSPLPLLGHQIQTPSAHGER